MRLDRFIANATGLSRNQVQQHIKDGSVWMDGVQARNGAQPAGEQILLQGVPVVAPQPVYLMLHKPVGYVCANTDGNRPTVLDLLGGERFHPTEPLQIVGRLDLDTTGLVLLTTDGHWNHKITAPNSHCTKTYRVQLANELTAEAQADLQKGILLRSETAPTLPCTIVRLSATNVEIHLQEGRYHQVKRMFAAVGNHVIALHRSAIGKIVLDPTLTPGEFRPLTTAEIHSIAHE